MLFPSSNQSGLQSKSILKCCDNCNNTDSRNNIQVASHDLS